MTKLKFVFIATALYSLGIHHSYGQGCSDAGFCTINSFKPNTTDSTKLLNNQFKIGAFYGKADNSISVYGTYLEYNRELSEKFGLDAKLTTIAQNGNGLSVFGLSDIFVNANYKASERVKFTLGVKIPLSIADKAYDNRPLPMDYQASLGTLDLIFGIGYEIKKIQFEQEKQNMYERIMQEKSISSCEKFLDKFSNDKDERNKTVEKVMEQLITILKREESFKNLQDEDNLSDKINAEQLLFMLQGVVLKTVQKRIRYSHDVVSKE